MTPLSSVELFPSFQSEHFAVPQGEEDDSEDGEHDAIQDCDRPVDRNVVRCHEENAEDVRKETCREDGGYGDPPPGRTKILEDGELPSLRLILQETQPRTRETDGGDRADETLDDHGNVQDESSRDGRQRDAGSFRGALARSQRSGTEQVRVLCHL